MQEQRSGFIGIVGPTNSGKSTLLNALVGHKVSIVSAKKQTTYHGVRGIAAREGTQAIYVDTPGFQNHPDRVARLLNKVADKHAQDCDLLMWVFDASGSSVSKQVHALLPRVKELREAGKKSICVLNKVDRVAKLQLLPLIQELAALEVFDEIIPISALKGDGLKSIEKVLLPQLPEGPALYPTEQVTDRPQDFVVSEMIREKIYLATRQELPYSARVEIENWGSQAGESESKVPTVHAIIHVDSDSRKGILIGKGGEMLKKIGSEARADIEKFLGKHICLKLHVDVEPSWKEDAHTLNRYLELDR